MQTSHPTMRNFILNLLTVLLILSLNCEACLEEEREALLKVKTSINSPEGAAFSTWYGKECCRWEGVECDESTYRVIKIYFQYRRMTESEWYPNITLFSQFKDLQELHLPGNKIAGFISSNALHKLKHLQKLDLHDNLIADSSHFCWRNITTISYINLSGNKLQGDIPNCLCESQSLTDLILSHNQLFGNIDACLSDKNSLKHLFVSDNQFNGTFPSLLFHNLTNIETIVMSLNDFKGVVSFSTFANLSKLSHLDISFNLDLGIETESPTWSPSFSLKQLKLGGCNLNKRSGRNIPNFLCTQYNLESLDLSYNSLVGTIPSWLLYNLSSELWIRGNNLTGPFPTGQRNTSSQLVTLDISDNFLYGLLPADVNHIFPELRNLNASHNMFQSTIPQSFAKLTQLLYLDLSSNILQGEIPHGIFSNMTFLQLLKVSRNKFEGEVLLRNFGLPDLRWLYLDGNGFAGSFLDSLSMCSSLQVLSIQHNDFSGDISTSFPVLPKLRALSLKGNQFTGSIPLQVCQLKHLHALDLSENSFSGEIPTCLSNITSMTEGVTFSSMTEEVPFSSQDLELHSWVSIDLIVKDHYLTFSGWILPFLYAIDLSLNKLTGTIPIQMTELIRIISLNMSNNFLTGQILPSLANLEQLESLDLSYNRFSGNLPSNLTSLDFLADFNLSFNNLSGHIPEGRQFSTFDRYSYVGNPNLCGRPLEKECNQLVEKSKGKQIRKTWMEIMKMSALVLWNIFLFLF